MREVVQGVFLEDQYPGVILGAVAAGGEVLLVDTPLRIEDGREWLGELSAHGRSRMLVLLDSHPDRVLGARGLDLAVFAHQSTRETVASWPDVYRPSAGLGAEADRLRRVAGLHRAADPKAWLEGLHELRGGAFRKYRILSSRDGVVRGEALPAMAAFLRKVDGRLTRMQARGEPAEATGRLAQQLARTYRVGAARKEMVAQRLRSGLETLYLRRYADDE